MLIKSSHGSLIDIGAPLRLAEGRLDFNEKRRARKKR